MCIDHEMTIHNKTHKSLLKTCLSVFRGEAASGAIRGRRGRGRGVRGGAAVGLRETAASARTLLAPAAALPPRQGIHTSMYTAIGATVACGTLPHLRMYTIQSKAKVQTHIQTR